MQYLQDLIDTRTWLLAIWVFIVGSAIGSFLNVVVYRLPRGMSLSRPGSHCPKCGHAIRWYHNLPIVGWFLLRGKCYDCKAAISSRYPLVEFTVAAIFVVLAYVDVYVPMIQADDATAPINSAPPGLRLGFSLIEFAAHAWLACSVLSAALIRYDGQRVPWPLVVPGLAVAAGVAVLLDRAGTWSLIGMGVVLLLLAMLPRNKKPPTSAGG